MQNVIQIKLTPNQQESICPNMTYGMFDINLVHQLNSVHEGDKAKEEWKVQIS